MPLFLEAYELALADAAGVHRRRRRAHGRDRGAGLRRPARLDRARHRARTGLVRSRGQRLARLALQQRRLGLLRRGRLRRRRSTGSSGRSSSASGGPTSPSASRTRARPSRRRAQALSGVRAGSLMELDEAVSLLEQLVEIESPTYSPGVARGRRGDGRHAARRSDARRPSSKEATCARSCPGDGEPLLLVGHTDTVWPEGTLATMPFRVEDGRAYGPGVYDMKACLVVIVAADRRSQDGSPPCASS